MLKDLRDLPVTAGDPCTVDHINTFIDGFLGYETKAASIVGAADADADSPLANAYAAMFCMFLESPAAPDLAAGYVARAEAAARHATDRERMVIEAVRAWAAGDIPHAIAVSEETAARHPRELATAKTCQYHYFNLGDAPGMLRISHKIMDANADVAHAHGMAAFACEQAHLLDDAETAARRAIALRHKEPWAHHALAHVFLAQGRTAEGRDFLEDIKDTWTDLNSFMLTHNWWHLALVLIDQGEAEDVLAHYDSTIWGAWKEYSQDQIGAVSLLARLELAGIDVGNRWADVGSYLQARVRDTVQPFLTVQYLYGLARAGLPEADTLLKTVHAFADRAPDFVRATWREVAVPVCEALLAHARGDVETTVRRLTPVMPRLAEIGGSHAQRDLFEQIWLDALLRTGRLVAAQRILEQRRHASPQAVLPRRTLAVLYDRLDLPAEAARLRPLLRLGH
jgi:tetratricopeptide (TPR) repeat protein